MDASTLAGIGGGFAGVIGAAVAVGAAVGRPLRRLAKQNDEFRQDWYGQPARPGHDPQPGVMERLRGIEKELHPNGGGTLRDAIGRVEQRLEDHLRSHQSAPSG